MKTKAKKKNKQTNKATKPSAIGAVLSIRKAKDAWRDTIPFDVWRAFGSATALDIVDEHFYFNAQEGDGMTIGEAQLVVDWLAEQLGGSVTWRATDDQ
jgi:hypothetical protein